MQGLVFDGVGRVDLADIPEPSVPEGWALLDVLAAGICGSDIDAFARGSGRRAAGVVMGHEAVGRLAQDVGGFAEGDVVCFSPVVSCGECAGCASGVDQLCARRRLIGCHVAHPGAFAERVAVPARNLAAWPDRLPAEAGALVEPVAVGLHAVRSLDADLRSGAVLVIGAGMIGLACALAAVREGAGTVHVLDLVGAKAAKSALVGGEPLVVEESLDDYVREHRPDGYRFIIDAVGSSSSLASALSASSIRARCVLVGLASPTVTVDAHQMVGKECTIISSYSFPRVTLLDAIDLASDSASLLQELSEVVPLSTAPVAFARLAEPGSEVTKVLLDPTGCS